MYKYDYTFYNADEGLLFALNHSGTPNLITDDFYYTYNATLSSLKAEASSASINLNHSEDYSLYPMAVRYADPKNNFYIIERPPFQIDVDFSTSRSYRQRKSPKYLSSTKIWIPWTVSIISYNKSSSYYNNSFSFAIYFNNKPLHSLDEHIVSCYLPNSDYYGRICMGQDSLPVNQMIAQNPKDIASIYNTAFNSYFAGWNSDLAPEFLLTPYIKDLITNRISKVKGSPKYYRDLVYDLKYSSHFNGNNNRILSSILYTISNMSLDEVFQYIESCKESYANNPNSYKKHLLKDRAAALRSYSFNPYNNQTPVDDSTYFNYINSYLFSNTQPVSSRLVVAVTQAAQNPDCTIADFIDNPYIISKIYSYLYQQYASLTSEYQSNTLFFPVSEVIQYNKPHQYLHNKESEQDVVVSS